MATIRLIPSAYSLSNTSYLSVSNASNMYDNTDSTTYATVTNSRTSTTSYYIYLKGFNFDDIPSNAIVNSFTVKLKAYESGVSTSSSYAPKLVNNTTTITSSCSAITTSAQTLTFTGVTADWDTIVGYGSNFGIRINCRRASRYTTGYVYIYGAEILVDYTVPTYHTVSVTQSTGGTISLSQSGQVLEGTIVTATATPSDGYELENIYVNGNVLSGTSFVVDEDKAVSAVFNQLITHTVSTSITGGTLRTPTTASMTVSDGDDCEVTFNGEADYTFLSMTVNGVEVTPIIKNAPAPLPTYTVSTNYGTYSTYALSNAYDGDDSTYFWSNQAQASGKYILITFSDFVNLSSFSTYSSNSTDYPQSCNVLQVSADNSSWTDIGTFSDSQTTTFSSITNANNIKYVRIYANSTISNWLVLNEITMNYEAAGVGEGYYSYTIPSVDADATVVIIFAEPPAHYVKVDGDWKKVLTIYKKINGVWAEFEYAHAENEKLIYKGHIISDVIGEVTSDYAITITDTSIPNETYYFYYEDENKQKLTDWDVIGSTEFNGYNGGTITTGEEVGTIASDNTISLTDASLAFGDYTLYYEDADGTKLEGWDSIGTITK